VMRELLARGASVDAVDDRGRTALMIAAEDGEATAVRLLLESGARSDLVDGGGQSACALAAAAGQTSITDLLDAAQAC